MKKNKKDKTFTIVYINLYNGEPVLRCGAIRARNIGEAEKKFLKTISNSVINNYSNAEVLMTNVQYIFRTPPARTIEVTTKLMHVHKIQEEDSEWETYQRLKKKFENFIDAQFDM